MANRSYLCLVNKASLSHSSSRVLAMDAWAVPLLWLALFRPKDVRRDNAFNDDGERAFRFAPIAAKKRALAQLDAAVPYLNCVFKDQGPLDDHAALFKTLFDRSRLGFVCIDLLEVAYTEDPDAYYNQLLAALTALENQPAPAVARHAFLALTHLRLKKKFPPARCGLDDSKITQNDAWNMARLFGTAWENPVPWEAEDDFGDFDRIPVGDTPLHEAVQRGDLSAVKRLLKAGADPNAKNDLGATPLDDSPAKGPVMVKALLKAGADPRLANDALGMALTFAPPSDRTTVVQLLLDHGADPNGRKVARGQILFLACTNGWDEVVRLLLDAGADVNARGGEGPPLIGAVTGNRLQLIELLIRRGANVNLTDRNRLSPMSVAKLTNKEAIVALLRRHGAKG